MQRVTTLPYKALIWLWTTRLFGHFRRFCSTFNVAVCNDFFRNRLSTFLYFPTRVYVSYFSLYFLSTICFVNHHSKFVKTFNCAPKCLNRMRTPWDVCNKLHIDPLYDARSTGYLKKMCLDNNRINRALFEPESLQLLQPCTYSITWARTAWTVHFLMA